MLRRFGVPNARNLLYFQSGLAQIEEDLKELDWEDNASTVGKKNIYASDFYCLKHATTERITFSYNKMASPDACNITNMQRFTCRDLIKYKNVLFGFDMDTWDTILEEDSHSKELVVMRGREAPDTFSYLASSISAPLVGKSGCGSWAKPDPGYGLITVRDATILNLRFWITSFITSVMPVLSLVMLSKLEGLNARLGVIAVSSVMLSVCLLLCTEAKRTDVFATTAT
ncbi:hypothetical protein HBI56_128100 [Parastagonospora nodorum]|nr:hypothetical protein HBH56_155730 [Parastagonospora nodorum]KAH3926668.1 hypothetical protein HBH54_161940 [Parastagonospora nodorum]KAH3943299.1 hypothetical protein HBH53_177220 [Parastagonospora nodorum]KAH3970221.1 hypothetical protein HBH52_168920 [Parastagonospora nodorum]KAH3972204.1 hypothetical protein HBH51_104280 [Parastagonospora nodorum]